jgi:hypothetical protein
MSEQEKKLAVAAHRKNYCFGNRAGQTGAKLTYKSKVTELEEDTFDVRASSNPARFSKSLMVMETYIHKIYKLPDDIVKAIQQMKLPTYGFSPKPTKAMCLDVNGDYNEDKYKMAKFTWKEEYKSTL